MDTEEVIQKEATRIQRELAHGATSITLDKRSIKKKPATKRTSNQSKSQSSAIDKEPQLAGYKLGDLVRAPVKAPEPIKTDSYSETANKKVVVLVIIGALISLTGLIVIGIINIILGVVLIGLGAVAILFGVFARVE